MNELEDIMFSAYPEPEEPLDMKRDLPKYCVMEDEDFEESLEE